MIPREACYNVPAWHRSLLADYAASTPEVARVGAVGETKAAGFQDGYLPELYHRLYSESPNEIPADVRSPAAAVRAKLHSLASELPEFDTLRKQTLRDPLWSGMASTAIAESVASVLPDRKDEPVPDAEQALRILDGMRNLAEEGAVGDTEVGSAAGKAFAATDAVGEQAASLNESAIRQALRGAIEAAQGQIDSAQQALSVLSGGAGVGSGAGGIASPTVALELARRVRGSAKLAKIIAMAGRLQATARAKRATRSEYARSELSGVDQTGDVARLLPSEMSALGDPLRATDLLRRVVERSALGYKIRGKEKSARGPIVVALDISGSMYGDKDCWAKAVVLALLDTARAEKRGFGVILFNGAVVAELRAPKAETVTPAQILDLLSNEPRGGTDFDVPVHAALDFIEKQAAFKKADVILVTDALIGGHHLVGAAASKARADKLGATVYGILIGAQGEVALKAYCHEVARIDDVSRDTAATDLVFNKI
jgi:uncharacterized protein with von Willebrand factor type A (vWA) domain